MSISQNYPTVRPQLLIDLANTQQLDPRVTFARATTGTYYDENGVLQTAPSGVPRFQFDPVTGVSQGLLRENQATNLVTYSESQSLNWSVQGAGTFSASLSVAPDGQTGNVTRVQGTVLNDGASKAFTAPSSAQYFGTMFARSRTGATQQCKIAYSGSTGATIDIPASGWTRIGRLSSALGSGAKYISIRSIGDPIDLDIYGVQTELNFFPTSYIKTEASQVTRSADTATLTNVGEYNTAEFTAISQPFGVASVASNRVTLNGDVPIERLYVYPRNISQNEINSVVGNDGWWSWRIVGSTFALPQFVTDGSIQVDWGDGTVETLTTAVHTFTNASPHTVKFRQLTGTYFRPQNNGNATYAPMVVAVGSAPSNMLVDGASAFYNCSNLKSIDATLIGTGSFNRAFRACVNLPSFPFINTSSVSVFSDTWTSCSNLTSFPLIDTSSGTTFSQTWSGCSSLTSFPLIDTSSVTVFTNTWLGCASLTSFPLIDTGSGTTFANTWQSCTSLTSFPLIDTSSGTNFTAAWFGCNKLTSFPLIDTSSATTLLSTWFGCSSLTSFPLIDTSNVTTLGTGGNGGTWANCTGLTSFPLLNISNVTSFGGTSVLHGVWGNCSSMTTFPANMFDTWVATPISNCFGATWDGCTALTTTSVENILVSINTSGVSAPATGTEITISYNVATGALTTPTTTAITALKGKNWTIRINGVLQ